MKPKKKQFNWYKFIIILIIIMSLIGLFFTLKNDNKNKEEASQYCIDNFNGELVWENPNYKCLIEQEGLIYSVLIKKYKKEWRAFVE